MAKKSKSTTKQPLTGDLEDLLILGKVIDILSSGQPCTRDKVAAELRGHISPHRVTKHFKSWMPRLGATATQPGSQIELDQAVRWFQTSRMYARVLKPTAGKEQIALAVVKKIRQLINSGELSNAPWAFFDAGTTTLACERSLHESIRPWHVLTNNLWISMDMLAMRHGHCYMPTGRPDTDTAAIIQTLPNDLVNFFQQNPPDISLVSFHYLHVHPPDEFIFCVEVDDEQATKIAGMRQATEAVFILIDKSKIQTASHGTPTVRFKNGEWSYYTPGVPSGATVPARSPLQMKAKRLFLCTDADKGKFSYLQSIKSASIEAEVIWCG